MSMHIVDDERAILEQLPATATCDYCLRPVVAVDIYGGVVYLYCAERDTHGTCKPGDYA